MNAEMMTTLRTLLIKHEGCSLSPYLDSLGNLTIGVGRNLYGREFYTSECELMLSNDIDYFYTFLSKKFYWFNELNDARKCALVDMCFIGTKKFLTFKRMIGALALHDYSSAAKEILNSLYAKQVGNRAIELSEIIESGMIK